MIKFYISYFYQIRNMKPNMLPVSTAMWDPAWFHKNKSNYYRYMDNNGVINGVRMIDLMMPLEKWNELVKLNESCKHCYLATYGMRESWVPGQCPFMQEYAKCIREKNPDFQIFVKSCEEYLQVLNKKLNLNLDTLIFIVHEPPTRICGERPEIQKWFLENGYELKEFNYNE